MADDATWLPEGALVVLGPCQVGDCDRVGWAIPTYGQLVMEFTVAGEPSKMPPHTMEGILLQVAWWCPTHGYGCHEGIARKWAQQLMDDVRARVPYNPEGNRWQHEKNDIHYVVGRDGKLPMSVRSSRKDG